MLLKQVSEILPWHEVFALGFGTNVNPFVGIVCDNTLNIQFGSI